MKKITKLDPVVSIPAFPKLQRVAAYARVSTEDEKQHMSLIAQMDYYKKLIEAHPGWLFAGIYADNGITGTSYRKRDQFKKMIEDCEAGKIDRIISKSISRFARNTVDTIAVIRRLKVLGIGVEFEKEQIWTLDGKGEFVLTLMASFAQEESRSISENTAWGIRKRFADGKYWVGYKGFLGYGPGFIIEEEGAYVVRLIYQRFLQGFSGHSIAKYLTENGFSTPQGASAWSNSTVVSILRNEKYKGDARTQKYFVKGFPDRKEVTNKGEVQQYYVSDGHEAIIEPVLFDHVQSIFARRCEGSKYSGVSFISNKFFCAECGGMYGYKPIHSNDKYRHNILQCRNRFKKGILCHNRHFHEREVPGIMGETFKTVSQKYDVWNHCCKALEKAVKSDRIPQIQKHIDSKEWMAEEAEWAMLVDRIDVYKDFLIATIWGGDQIRIEM